LRTSEATSLPKLSADTPSSAQTSRASLIRDHSSRSGDCQSIRTHHSAMAGSTPSSAMVSSMLALIHSVASRESVSYTLASAWRSITAPKSLMKNAAPADSSSTSVSPGLNVQRKLSGSSMSAVRANSAAATAVATPAPRRPEKSCAENTTCQKRLLAAATRNATTSRRTVLARSSGRREERSRDLDIGAGCGRRLGPA
jgi:hypothetical protein